MIVCLGMAFISRDFSPCTIMSGFCNSSHTFPLSVATCVCAQISPLNVHRYS